jgi:hypothetical protein
MLQVPDVSSLWQLFPRLVKIMWTIDRVGLLTMRERVFFFFQKRLNNIRILL